MMNFYFKKNSPTVAFTNSVRSVDKSTKYSLYTHVMECEAQLLSKSTMSLQTLSMADYCLPDVNTIMSAKMTQEAKDWCIDISENMMILLHSIKKAQTLSDLIVTCVTMYKLFSRQSVCSGISSGIAGIMKYVTDLMEVSEPELQSQEYFDMMGSLLDGYKSIRNAPIIKKIHELVVYILSTSFFSRLDVAIPTATISTLYMSYVSDKDSKNPVDFVMHILECLKFVIERGYQCFKLGSFAPIFHSDKTYAKWVSDVYLLKEDSLKLHNPEATGVNYHEYLSRLDDVIETGINIIKFADKATKNEKLMFSALLSQVRLLKANELTKKAAQETRRPPMSVLVYGGSSVGKSGFMDLLFTYFAKIYNMPLGDEYKYARCVKDEYYSGFRTCMWCIIMDDIAIVNPNKGQEDPSLNEIIMINNGVAVCPPQADLENKGKTPLRPDLFIGSTNTKDLNADYWFSNGAAIKRRFPYVITLEPKPQYARDDAPDMLDGNKAPSIPDGCYPDLWNITLSKVVVVPGPNGSIKQATREDVISQFSSIYDFLLHFKVICDDHRSIQNKMMISEKITRGVSVCDACFLPSGVCKCIQLQSGEIDVNLDANGYSTWGSAFLLGGLAFDPARVNIVESVSNFTEQIQGNIVDRGVQVTKDVAIRLASECGERMKASLLSPKIGWLLAGIAGFIGLYQTGKWMYKLYSDETPLSLQTIETRRPSGSDEKENVWIKSDYNTVSLDLSEPTKSWNSLPFTRVLKNIQNNVVAMEVRYEKNGNRKLRCGTALNLGGHLYVSNLHHFSGSISMDVNVTLLTEPRSQGVTNNVSCDLDHSNFYVIPERDLCFFEVLATSPFKRISQFFPKRTLQGKFDGAYLISRRNAEKITLPVKSIVRNNNLFVDALNLCIDSWEVKLQQNTKEGDCGAVLVAHTPLGPACVGIHQTGGVDNMATAIAIYDEDIQKAIIHFNRPLISQENPIMEGGQEKTLLPLKHKSVFRYIDDGTAKVYGTLSGVRSCTKSKVTATYMQEAALKKGYVIRGGAPIMRSWVPHRAAAIDIVQQKHKIVHSRMKMARDGYIQDILDRVSQEDLEELKYPLDFKTTINGMPGVQFIDKINRQTSAGFPFYHSKKTHLVETDGEGIWQEPVDVTPDIKERYDKMMARYKDLRRASPIFVEHLKDEVRSFKKIADGLTRAFNGGPFDWSIIVRQFLLPFVRVFQKNKYIFEGAPGTVAQSIEWDQMRSYLIQHGVDRMIAGDFKAFDKNMGAELILYAFDVIIAVLRCAGMDEECINIIYGIAEDTAFSWCDFDGDLVEFLGSNPSGHPLTVIVNCIVNSLYFRYCYIGLNPGYECHSFKKNVALITYGDDNAAGSKIDWFNHTAIVAELAKIGVKYTMADKESESVPFINMNDVTFLKRSWRFDEDLGKYVGPLDHESIDKMLTTWIPSTTVSPVFQAADVISTAVREYFWYGRQVFEEKSKVLREIFVESGLSDYEEPSTFPSWEELKLSYEKANMDVLFSQRGREMHLKYVDPPVHSSIKRSMELQSCEFDDILGKCCMPFVNDYSPYMYQEPVDVFRPIFVLMCEFIVLYLLLFIAVTINVLQCINRWKLCLNNFLCVILFCLFIVCFTMFWINRINCIVLYWFSVCVVCRINLRKN